MGEVLCTSRGDLNTVKKWVDAQPDRFVVWAGSNAFEHPRVFQAQNNELILQQIASELIFLPFVYEDPEHPVLQNFARIQSEISLRVSDFMDQGEKLLSNFKAQLAKPFACANELYGKFQDIPVILCGAGPSIQEAIPFLKAHPDRFLIIGCGAGMQVLLSHGIKPHLAVHIDPNPHHSLTQKDIPFFFQLRTFPLVSEGSRFLMAGSGEFPLERYLEDKLNLEPPTDGGWTAVTRAVVLAHALGSKEIYFTGVDFYAKDGKAYAKGVEGRGDETTIKVRLQDQEVYTKQDWLLAADWLSQWAASHPDVNCSFLMKSNPLMPTISAREPVVRTNLIPTIPQTPVRSGIEAWEEIGLSFERCNRLIDQFLEHFQTIFPRSPFEDEKCSQLLMEIDQQLAVRLALEPIWSVWEVVLKRQPDTHKEALAIHRILLLKNLCSKNIQI